MDHLNNKWTVGPSQTLMLQLTSYNLWIGLKINPDPPVPVKIHEVDVLHHFGPDWNFSSSFEGIGKWFSEDIDDPQRVNSITISITIWSIVTNFSWDRVGLHSYLQFSSSGSSFVLHQAELSPWPSSSTTFHI